MTNEIPVEQQQPQVPAQLDTQQCPYCKSDISREAKKCPRCRSFLGWIGRVRNATTELTIISLTVSILALALPSIQKSLLPQRSDIVVSVLRPYGLRFEFIVSNKGNRPAAITEAGVEFPSTHNGKMLQNWVLLDRAAYATLIEPEKSYRFGPEIMSGLPPQQPSPGMETEAPTLLNLLPENCKLKVVYIDFDGSEKVIRKPYRCAAG
ncbi:MAG: hypothetical protein IPH35_11575 [Rhodoferax sp.]|nr:hypothetical protein [Rhodoferax sp.]